MKILAGYVLYHEDVERLRRNIGLITDQVDGILLVCNDDAVSEGVMALAVGNEKVHLIANGYNAGMAYACNRMFGYAVDHGYDWVLTLDQDTDCHEDLIEQYVSYSNLDCAGILTCGFMDRNTGLVKREVPLRCYEGYNEVGKCIQSGAFCNVSAFRNSDGFDESMFIDEVDRDYCWDLRYHGYRIYELNIIGIDHTLGRSSVHKLGNRRVVVYDESVFRHYYIARNTVYIHRKYAYRSEGYMRRYELSSRVKILLFESDKLAKLKARDRGIRDGYRMKVKKCLHFDNIVGEGDAAF